MIIAVVEDSSADRERAAACLRRFWRERDEVDCLSVMTYSSGDEFIAALSPGQFALVLMDCRMEGADGLEAAQALRRCDKETALIFITSSRDYAVDGYQVAAAGYLVKPYTYEAFAQALTLAWPRVPGRRARLRLTTVEEEPVFLDEIVFCDIEKHYCQIHLIGPEVLRVRMTFSNLMKELSSYPQFLPCFRGCVVNMDHIRKMEDLNFLMDTEERVPFRKKEHAKLLQQYSNYLFDKAGRGKP